MTKNCSFKYAVTVAENAPAYWPAVLRGSFAQTFRTAKELEYDGVEILLRAPEDFSAEDAIALASDTGIEIASVTTGLAKCLDGLTMTDSDIDVRKRTVLRLKEFVDWAEVVGCCVIVGSIHGNLPDDDMGASLARTWMRECFDEVFEYAQRQKVEIDLEPINHHEYNVMNSTEETMDYIRSFNTTCCKLHLDTLHMYYDEPDKKVAI